MADITVDDCCKKPSAGERRRGIVFGVAERTDGAVAHGRAVGIGGMVLRTRLLICGDVLDVGLVDMSPCMMLAGNDRQEDERNRHQYEQS